MNKDYKCAPFERNVMRHDDMTVLDIADDDALRFVQRVLESEATPKDRLLALEMIVKIRTRMRRTSALY